MFEDRSGRIWAATIGEGLALFDSETEEFVLYRHDPFEPDSLTDNVVFSIFEDRDGLLWIGTNRGVSVLEPSRQAFAVYEHDPLSPHAGSYSNLVALEQDPDGQIWLGTFGDGLIRLDADRKGPARFRKEADGGGLPHNIVWDIHADTRGDLWLGTENGLSRIDSEDRSSDPTFTTFRHNPDDANSLPAGRMLRIYEDKDSMLWLGSPGGLSRMDSESQSFRNFSHDPEQPDSISPFPVLAIHQDPSGALWIGLDGGGLDRFDPESETFSHYPPDLKDPNGLGGAIVTTFEDGPDGTLWVASYGGGLELFDPDTGEFLDVLPADFPADPSVTNLLKDSSGALWFTMGAGLYRYRHDHRELTAYDPSDRRVLSYPPGSAVQTAEGELLWGGSSGFVSVTPDRLLAYERPPLVAITDFRVLNRELEPSEWRGGTVTLSHKDQLFWIDFAALHFADPSRNRYQYRIGNLSDDWIQVDASGTSVQLSSLRPGSHKFQVQASHKDGVWNRSGDQLEIVVLPAPWKSAWAFLAYGSVLALLVWTYFRAQRIKLNNERAIAEREREINRLRDKFLDEMAGFADAMAKGDLRHEVIPISQQDLFGQAFKNMTSSLRGMIGDVQKAADLVETTSQDISNSAAAIAQGAKDQSIASGQTHLATVEIASQIERIAQSSQELAGNVEETSASIQEMNAASEQIALSSDTLLASVGKTLATIEEMAGSVDSIESKAGGVRDVSDQARQIVTAGGDELSALISSIGDASQDIGKIIGLVEDIADQTNLLALNAAIQAAHAGEFGRGFAVVAEEVKRLAERSVSSTREIAGVVDTVRDQTDNAIELTHRILGKILEAVSKTSELAHEVHDATREQSVSLSQVLANTHEMQLATEEVASAAQQQGDGSFLIVQAVGVMTDMTRRVVDAADSQKNSSDRVAHSIERISTVARQNQDSIDKLFDSIQELLSEATRLRRLAGVFVTDPGRLGTETILTD